MWYVCFAAICSNGGCLVIFSHMNGTENDEGNIVEDRLVFAVFLYKLLGIVLI